MTPGLHKIYPDRRDYSLLHSFGLTAFDPNALPEFFTVDDGRIIPDQEASDLRFSPALLPMPYGCTGEATSYYCGLEDGALYNPYFSYMSTPPHTEGTGRDLRAALQAAINIGLRKDTGDIGFKRTAYFNVYAAGKIDDFDAARIALWINQNEKRAVTVGSYWYPEFNNPINGIVMYPSFNTAQATLHNYLITGWTTIAKEVYLEAIPWEGMGYGNRGKCYISRPIFNALLNQPYSAMFTMTKTQGLNPVAIGYQAVINHLVAFIRNLFQV